MKLLWKAMGLWVWLVILGLMKWTGCVWLASQVLKILYRNRQLIRKPLMVATVFHLMLFGVFAAAFTILFKRLFG